MTRLQQAARLLLEVVDDPNREGLSETPMRFAKALDFFTSGYREDPRDHVKVFKEAGDSYDELVILRDVQVWSMCEHHLVPFFGRAHIGYVPDGRVIGLSKLARIVETFSRRLQVQERLTQQVSSFLLEHLKPLGVGVVMECRHLCVESRGIQKIGARMMTSSLLGCMREGRAREEFLQLVKKGE